MWSICNIYRYMVGNVKHVTPSFQGLLLSHIFIMLWSKYGFFPCLIWTIDKKQEINIQKDMTQLEGLFWWSLPWQGIKLSNHLLLNGDGTQGDITFPFDNWGRRTEDVCYSITVTVIQPWQSYSNRLTYHYGSGKIKSALINFCKS